MLFGVHEDTAPADLVKKYPGVKLTRPFVGGVLAKGADLVGKVTSACKPSWDAGLVPVVSFKTSPVETVSGLWDARLKQLGDYLAKSPETWVIYYHEPENDMAGKTFNPAFMRTRDVLKSRFPELKVGYSAMAYQWRSSSISTQKPADWRVVADFYGCDVYSGNSFPADAICRDHAGFKRWYANIGAYTTAPWGLTERGWNSNRTNTPGEDKLRAKNLMDDVLNLRHDCSFYMYWNTTGTEGDSKLLNGPSTTEMLQTLIRNYSDTPPPKQYKTCTECKGTGRIEV